VHVPLPADHPQRELLEKTALGCPVHRSLSADMSRPTKFFWEG
jgi:putative redox protein